MVAPDCEALRDALKLQHEVNGELNAQLRETRLELAAEIHRRKLVEAQKAALEGRLRAEAGRR